MYFIFDEVVEMISIGRITDISTWEFIYQAQFGKMFGVNDMTRAHIPQMSRVPQATKQASLALVLSYYFKRARALSRWFQVEYKHRFRRQQVPEGGYGMNVCLMSVYTERVSFHRANRYVGGLVAALMMAVNSALGCYLLSPILKSNRFESFDDDPLTSEEMMDLEISYREIAEGKGVELPAGMSVSDFLDSL